MKYLILIPFLLVLGCGDNAKMNYGEAPSSEFAVADLEVSEKEIYRAAGGESQVPLHERMLIKTGQLSMKVDEVQVARQKITTIAQQLNAYISDERLDDSGDRLNISMTIRVPSKLYDSLVASIEKVGEKTESKSVSTQDVTEEFIDTEARLKTKKELEARYREILRQANSVTDILAVESNLNTVRGEIESMEGRLKYLSSQVSFSTLSLSFYQSLSTDFGFGGQFVDGLKNGWTNLLSFLIGLINIWPFLILIGGGVWLFVRWRKKKKIA
jgi:Domain of unknown function (DUF4349)